MMPRLSEDKKHARTRFFPVRAKTWLNRTRDLSVSDDFEFPTEACIKDMVVDETGLPDPGQDQRRCISLSRVVQDGLLVFLWLNATDWCPAVWSPRTCATRCLQRFEPASTVTRELVIPRCSLESRRKRCATCRRQLLSALSPLDVDCGPVDRADQGYRVHTGMIKFSWSFKSVKSKIKDLSDPDDKARAQAARKYLLGCAETNMYAKIYQDHRQFLKDNIGDEDTEESTKYKRQRLLRWIEMEGLECAVWPHLYWKTSMCETAGQGLGHPQAAQQEEDVPPRSDESESDDEDADSSGRQSLKASFLAKVLGPMTAYGASFELMQFVYDLHMWTTLGAKRNLHKEVPLRLKVKGMSFSPMFWHERHLALMDLQRQLGYPTLFFTLSPYEWSWPYHAWVVDHLVQGALSASSSRIRRDLAPGPLSHSSDHRMADGCCVVGLPAQQEMGPADPQGQGRQEASSSTTASGWSSRTVRGSFPRRATRQVAARLAATDVAPSTFMFCSGIETASWAIWPRWCKRMCPVMTL